MIWSSILLFTAKGMEKNRSAINKNCGIKKKT